jgi:hypothetical protein
MYSEASCKKGYFASSDDPNFIDNFDLTLIRNTVIKINTNL